MSESESLSKSQLQYRRSKGVSKAWDRERELVRQGRGTREWTVAEQKQLLKTGRVKGYQGHHMKSVAKHPEYADDPKNIQFLKSRKSKNEHLKAHKGDYRNESDGRYNVKTDKIRPMKDGKPRAMNSYELKNKAIEKRGYTKYAADRQGAALQNGRKSANAAKTSTPHKGESYKRSMVKSPSKSNNTSTKKSTVKNKSSAPQKYGAKNRTSASAPARKSSGYASKVKSGSSGTASVKKSSSYGQKASGKSKSSSSGGHTRSSGGHVKSSGGQKR